MNIYNDYTGITRQWLRRYNDFIKAINNIADDIKVLASEIDNDEDIAAPIAKYSGMPGGGSSELNAVERFASRRMERKAKIAQLKADKAELARVVSKIERAINSLDNESADIIKSYYISNKSWLEIANKHHYSEEWTRKKSNKAIKRMALFIFGMKAMPEQLSFVFAI